MRCAAQAIFQCLQGLPEGGLRRIILTASGGAFRDWPVEKLKEVTAADAIKHPNWRWGAVSCFVPHPCAMHDQSSRLLALLCVFCAQLSPKVLLGFSGTYKPQTWVASCCAVLEAERQMTADL